jgi:hypothetical protein
MVVFDRGVWSPTIAIRLINMYFDAKWAERLSVLTKGVQITVLGRIDTIDRITISLRDCELIN